MALHLKTALLCDDIRQEDNGKFMIIGVYTPNMTVPQIPFVLPSLSFFLLFDADEPGEHAFKFNLNHLETGRSLVEGMGQIGVKRAGTAVMPLKLGNAQFQAVGSYTLSLSIDDAPPTLNSFDVTLNIPKARGQ